MDKLSAQDIRDEIQMAKDLMQPYTVRAEALLLKAADRIDALEARSWVLTPSSGAAHD